MRFDGERTVAAPVDAIYARLSDASFLASAIPDATPQGGSADSARCVVQPNLSFVRGKLDVVVTVLTRQPNSNIAFSIASQGIGASADVAAGVALKDDGDRTIIAWSAEIVRLTGLLRLAPEGLIRGAAHKVIDDVWTSIAARLASL